VTGAEQVDVVVVGAGIGGLVVARAAAQAGRSVLVLEGRDAPGGSVRAHTVASVTLDAGAESFATRDGIVAELLADLGMADQICLPSDRGAWVELATGPRPMPRNGVLGLPAHLLAADVRHALGPVGTVRAGLDLVAPASLGAGADTLGGLVRARLGDRVLERLVRPLVAGIHSADPDTVPLGTLAPHLAAALPGSRGSLTRAVRAVQAATPSGSAVQGLTGGMHRLTAALVDELVAAGGRVSLRAPVSGYGPEPGGWRVEAADGPVHTRQLVLAAAAPDGRPGLGAAGMDPGAPAVLVTLVLDDARLDAAPRGTGVLVAPGAGGVRAKALTHATAKWAWLAEAAGPGRHVLRLSYGPAGPGVGELPADRAALVELALADAGALLGLALSAGSLVDHDVVRWTQALPRPSAAHRAAVAEVRTIVGQTDGLEVAGGWVAGSGLAAVVADARAAADRILG
jgi:oxygen-dependent protoporphyrinogen oxidase